MSNSHLYAYENIGHSRILSNAALLEDLKKLLITAKHEAKISPLAATVE